MSYSKDLIGIASKKNINILDSSINGHKKLNCKCNTCGRVFQKYGYQIKGLDFPCPKCSKHFHAIAKRRINELDFRKKLKETKPNYLLVGPYVSLTTPTTSF